MNTFILNTSQFVSYLSNNKLFINCKTFEFKGKFINI